MLSGADTQTDTHTDVQTKMFSRNQAHYKSKIISALTNDVTRILLSVLVKASNSTYVKFNITEEISYSGFLPQIEKNS